MTVRQIETTIATTKTDLSCRVMIGYVSSPSSLHGNYLWWQLIAGRYRFGPKSGKWAYWRDGILLSRTTNINDPLFKLPANLLIVLSGVPERFAEKLMPGETLRGAGRHYTNNEELTWQMRLPIAPLRK